jgi:hypothetical protein
LPETGKAEADKSGRIVWTDSGGRPFRLLEVRRETLAAKRLVFLESGLEVAFGDEQRQDDILYSGDVRLSPGDGSGHVLIHYDKFVFNRNIPEQIFRIKTPGTYNKVEL